MSDDADTTVDLSPSAVSSRLGQQNARAVERTVKQVQQDQIDEAVASLDQQQQDPSQAFVPTPSLALQQQQAQRLAASQQAQNVVTLRDNGGGGGIAVPSFTRDYARQSVGGVLSAMGTSAIVAGVIGLLLLALLIVILVRTWRARTQLQAFGKALSDDQVDALRARGVDTTLNANTGFFGLAGNVVLFSLVCALPLLVSSIMALWSGIAIARAGSAVADGAAKV